MDDPIGTLIVENRYDSLAQEKASVVLFAA